MSFPWDESRRAFRDARDWFLRTAALVEESLGVPSATVAAASAADYFRGVRAVAAGPAVAARGRAAGEALGDDPPAPWRRPPPACYPWWRPGTARSC